ncbi:MAG: hypothetical protein J07HX5_00600 [halophilic archaeon J07HX5]|nr:MAG: hypothetical protein J07HX5_00600 [halophilic archaeon J07HX5]
MVGGRRSFDRDTANGSAKRILIIADSLFKNMPATEELRCTSDSCELDMFENHYTYEVDEDLAVSDLNCPLCGGTNCLEQITLS